MYTESNVTVDENVSVNLEPYCDIYTEQTECSNSAEAYT